MIKNILTIFIPTLIICTFLSKSYFDWQAKVQEESDIDQIKIIQENIRDRFKLSLDLPLSIGLIAADYFSQGDIHSTNFSPFKVELTKKKPDLKGLNILSPEGKILRVYPPERNQGLIGRTTRHAENLKKAYQENKPYYLTEPFDLLSSIRGFAFFLPIKQKMKLVGWTAVIMTSKLFYNKFIIDNYAHSFHLIIKDKQTDQSYFQTEILPKEDNKVFSSAMKMYGREFIFQSWRILPEKGYSNSWSYIIVIASLFSGVVTLLIWLYQQRKRTRLKFENIGQLLNLSSKEALSNLIDSQETQLNITTIAGLLEQVDLLQAIANEKGDYKNKLVPLLPIIQEPFQNIQEIADKKSITLEYNQANFEGLTVFGNSWLLQHSVISNILIHSLIYAKKGSSVKLNYQCQNQNHILDFTISKVTPIIIPSDEKRLDDRLEVAKRILQMHKGSLLIDFNDSKEMNISIQLPTP